MTEVRLISDWLTTLGYDTVAAAEAARTVLEAAKFTQPRKRSMSVEKLSRAADLLAVHLVRACDQPACQRAAPAISPAHRLVVLTTSKNGCEVCGGSNNRSAATAFVEAARRAGVGRVLIVGGSPVHHRELSRLAGSAVEFRFVDGAEGNHTKRDALANLQWADALVIWANTPLPHSVSVSYTDECPPGLPSVTVRRRGVEGLCVELSRLFDGIRPARNRG
ncbi:MAG TPA: hypothetical protein VIK11_12130 [Tepidiformaceae bacterium]